MPATRTVFTACTTLVAVFSALPLLSQPMRTIHDGVYSEAQADRGETLYLDQCATCHGQDLGGMGVAPALTGGNFLWTYDGLTVDVLFNRIRQTMPPDDPGATGAEGTTDIIAYLLQSNGLPAAERALPSQSAVLGMIRWSAM